MEHSIFGAKPFSLSGLSPHAIKERRRENFSGGRRWRWRISVFASMKFKTMKFLSHFIPRAHLCLRVCVLFSCGGASRLSLFLSRAPRRENCRLACVHKPDLLGSSNSRLISLSLLVNQPAACLPARSKFHLAGRARQFIAAEALNQAHGDHCQKYSAKGERGPGATTSIYQSQSSINYVIVKFCHEILTFSHDF